MGPGASPRCLARKPRVLPSAMKQMSWESGLSATARPRWRASSRASALVVSPRGDFEWGGWAGVGAGRAGDGQAALAGFLAGIGLGGVAEGEHRVGQLVAGQDGQHVGLVLTH